MADQTQEIINSFLSGSLYGDKMYEDYLHKIGSSTADQLSKEPGRLKSDKEQLLKQTQELAFSNYKTFIQTADCSRDLYAQFLTTEKAVDTVLKTLPSFQAQCQEVAKVSETVDKKKKLNQLMFSKSNQLLEILELPQLMDTCIRRGYFEEALELFSYIRRLGTKHGNIAIIANVVNELEGSWKSMIQQLLAELRSDLPLPKCLQIIGFLRRMDVYSDAELRLKFLQTRDAWLKKLLSSLVINPSENVSAKKLELLRVHLFSIVTQHRAIFSDEDSVNANEGLNEPSIYYSWIVEKIQQLLTVIEDGCSIKQISSVESLLGQSMYFGMSLSRVGTDFRGLVAFHVQKTILQNTETCLRRVARKFEQDMDRFVLTPTIAAPIIPDQSDGPPLILLDYLPLAELTNGVLRIFNDLRGCAPLGIVQGVSNALQELFKVCTKVILAFYRQEQASLGSPERVTLIRFCSAYQALIQHISSCFNQLFPIGDLSRHLGVPIHQLQVLNLVCLKDDILVEPLRHLMS